MENRFKMLTKSKPDQATLLFKMAQEDVETRYRFYQYMANRKFVPDTTIAAASATARA